jgi:hypothetical protein
MSVLDQVEERVLIGKVVDQPRIKVYTKEDGSSGARIFFRLNCGNTVIPVVAWEEKALWCNSNLLAGTPLIISGHEVLDVGFPHVVLNTVEIGEDRA